MKTTFNDKFEIRNLLEYKKNGISNVEKNIFYILKRFNRDI